MSTGRIAVMQPYLFPYPGYFGLFAAADTFVLLDDVQFNRRGRVHRVELPGPAGVVEWLTLPLARQPREVPIRELAFAAGAEAAFAARLRRFPELLAGDDAVAAQLRGLLQAPLTSVVEYLETGLRGIAGLLGLERPMLRSSTLGLDPALRGQDRIVAIVRALGGREYLNASGGRALYDADTFAAAGLQLRFLAPYAGAYPFLLPALRTAGPAAVRAEILRTTEVGP